MGLMDAESLPPPRTPLDELSFQEEKFVLHYMADGLFDSNAAVAYAYPRCPPEKRAKYASQIRRRPRVREAIQYVAAQATATLKERLEYTIARGLVLQAFFDPFKIIDRNGMLRDDVDEKNLGEYAMLIKGIDPRTGKVEFVDRQKALDGLQRYAGLSNESTRNIPPKDEKHIHFHLTEPVKEFLAQIEEGYND